MYHLSFIALDIARERTEEADRHRRAARARAGLRPRPSLVRRSTARMFASVSRSSAAAVRRLDAGAADELNGRLAPAE